jgi:hypothetical protein
MADPLMAVTEARVERPEPRGERRAVVANGDVTGTNGLFRRPLARAYALVAPLVLLATTVNVFSTLYDFHRGGKTLPLWEPVSWEATSAISILVAFLIIPLAARLAPTADGPASWRSTRWRPCPFRRFTPGGCSACVG